MSISSISSLLSSYSSSYSSSSSSGLSATEKSSLLKSLDEDGNKTWSTSELSTYANKYSQMTGTDLDVDKLMSAYDQDSSGTLSSTEQASALSADALGLGDLTSSDTSSTSSSSGSTLLDTLMTNSAEGYQYLMSSLVSESATSLISSMFGTDSSSSSLLNGVFGTTSAASAAASYFLSKSKSETTSSTVDTTA